MNGHDLDDHRPQELTDQQRVGVALMGDSSFSDLIEKLVLHHGPEIIHGGGGAVRARMIIEEIVDEIAEEGRLAGHAPTESGSTKGNVAIVKLVEYIWKKHPTPAAFATFYVMDIPWVDDVLGHKNPTQIAAEMGLTKQALNKAIQEASVYFNRPPRSDQRSKESRQRMSDARNSQLK